MRRFTRLTNGFSRKVENLAHAVPLHFMHYNFARPHGTLKEKYRRPRRWLLTSPITSGRWRRSRRCWTETTAPTNVSSVTSMVIRQAGRSELAYRFLRGAGIEQPSKGRANGPGGVRAAVHGAFAPAQGQLII